MIQEKKKLLVIINRLVIGGQALDTIPLLHRLQDDFDILVLYGRPEKDEAEATILLNKFSSIACRPIVCFQRSLHPVKDFKTFIFIIKAIRSFRPQVVHTHGMKPGLLGRISAWLCRVPCIIHTFHGHHFHSYFNSFLSKCLVVTERLLARITSKIVAISPIQKRELTEKYKIAAPAKITVIPLGIDDILFNGDKDTRRHRFREKYNLTDEVVAVGIVGRIVAIKNFEMFTRVAAGVLATNKDNVRFFIVGDGTEKAKVQNALSILGIHWCNEDSFSAGASVIFTSWVPEVVQVMYGLDIVMLTSHNEGTPMSLIEAQYCGKPVVAVNVGGVKDTFVDNETGFLIPAGNDNSFIQQINLLAGNEQLRNEMGSKGGIFARKNFSKAQEINSFKTLYLSCNT